MRRRTAHRPLQPAALRRRLWPGDRGAARHRRALRRGRRHQSALPLRHQHQFSIFAGNAYIAVAAIGMSMVIISGHIDVSVGSLIGVIATIAGTLAVAGYPDLDRLDGADPLRHRGQCRRRRARRLSRIPSIVVTLGMLSILKGGLISVTGGAWITDMPPDFMIAQMRLFGIPSAVYFMVVLTIARRALHALHRLRPRHLCGRRQPGGGARRGHQPRAHGRRRLRAARASSPASPAFSSPPSCR